MPHSTRNLASTKIDVMRSKPRKKRNKCLALSSCLLTALALTETGCEKVAEEEHLEVRNGLLYEIGADEPFTGNWTTYYEVLEGRRRHKDFHYENGLPQGPFETFYPHGITETRGSFVIDPEKNRSLKQGEFLAWRENGTLIHKKFYKNGELEGPYFLYHDKWIDEKDKEASNGNQLAKDAVIMEQAEYGNGLRNGPYSRFQKSGHLQESGSYYDGLLDGHQTIYYPSIHHLRIRDHRDLLLSSRYPANSEGFSKVSKHAYDIEESLALDHNPEGRPMSIEGFDATQKFLAVLWTTHKTEALSSNDLEKSRPKYLRAWQSGQRKQSTWFDFDGNILFKGIEVTATANP